MKVLKFKTWLEAVNEHFLRLTLRLARVTCSYPPTTTVRMTPSGVKLQLRLRIYLLAQSMKPTQWAWA